MCRFSGYRFRLFFLKQGLKIRDVFWSTLSKHVKRGNFARSGYYLVQFVCFGVYSSPIFSRTGYHLEGKILEKGEKTFFLGTPLYTFRSSTPPPGVEYSCPFYTSLTVQRIVISRTSSSFLCLAGHCASSIPQFHTGSRGGPGLLYYRSYGSFQKISLDPEPYPIKKPPKAYPVRYNFPPSIHDPVFQGNCTTSLSRDTLSYDFCYKGHPGAYLLRHKDTLFSTTSRPVKYWP